MHIYTLKSYQRGMHMKKHNWTPEQDEVLVKHINSNKKIKEAIKNASVELKLSYMQCKNRWYNKLHKSHNTEIQDFIKMLELIKNENIKMKIEIREKDDIIKELKEEYYQLMKIIEKARNEFTKEGLSYTINKGEVKIKKSVV